MAQYQFLQDVYVNGYYFQAGTTAFTADIQGGLLPVGWVPNGAVTPLDANAKTAFYDAGPQPPPRIVQQWQNQSVSPPSIYWLGTATQGATEWQLVGTNLPVIHK